MFYRITRIAAASVGACALAVAGTTGIAEAETSTDTDDELFACGDGFEDLDDRHYDYTFASEEVPMLTGPHDVCDVIETADFGQRTDYHCYAMAGDSTWTYLRNVATGTKGWVNDKHLTDGGSDKHC